MGFNVEEWGGDQTAKEGASFNPRSAHSSARRDLCYITFGLFEGVNYAPEKYIGLLYIAVLLLL
jgi:hypothetical protein